MPPSIYFHDQTGRPDSFDPGQAVARWHGTDEATGWSATLYLLPAGQWVLCRFPTLAAIVALADALPREQAEEWLRGQGFEPPVVAAHQEGLIVHPKGGDPREWKSLDVVHAERWPLDPAPGSYDPVEGFYTYALQGDLYRLPGGRWVLVEEMEHFEFGRSGFRTFVELDDAQAAELLLLNGYAADRLPEGIRDLARSRCLNTNVSASTAYQAGGPPVVQGGRAARSVLGQESQSQTPWEKGGACPSPIGWDFRPRQAAFYGKVFPVAGVLGKLLRRLAQAGGRLVEKRDLKQACEDDLMQDKTLQGHLAYLRALLRKHLGPTKDFDPIPHEGRGDELAYRLAMPSESHPS
jgi:hypothetical protein